MTLPLPQTDHKTKRGQVPHSSRFFAMSGTRAALIFLDPYFYYFKCRGANGHFYRIYISHESNNLARKSPIHPLDKIFLLQSPR